MLVTGYSSDSAAAVDAILVVEKSGLTTSEHAMLQVEFATQVKELGLSTIEMDQVGTYLEALRQNRQCDASITADCLAELGALAVARTAAVVSVKTSGPVVKLEGTTINTDRTGKQTLSVDAPLAVLQDEPLRKRHLRRLAVSMFAPDQVGTLVLFVTPTTAKVLVDGNSPPENAIETVKLYEEMQRIVLQNITEGEHDVSLRLEGGEQQDSVVNVRAGTQKEVRLNIESKSEAGKLTT